MIVISSDLVLASDGLSLDHPIIGWENIVTTTNIAATTENASYPVTNLANPATNLVWKGSDDSQQYLTITTGSADPLDYVAIARHNFSSAGLPVSLEADDGGGYDELIAPFIPVDDGPLILRFTQASYASVRIKLAAGDLTPAVVPQAAVVYAGKLLVLPRKIYQNQTPLPHGRKRKVTNGRSESGEYLGRIVLGEWTETNVPLSMIEPTYYREHIDAFLEAAAETPFFFGWRPQSYPYESGYAFLTNDPRPVNAQQHGLISLDLQLSGVV